MTKHGLSIEEKFEMKVASPDERGCTEWTAATQKDGYGVIGWDGKIWTAHRLAYHLYVGSIPKGMHILHTCDNRKCVNVKHLFVGTNKDNMQDMVSKKRQSKAQGKLTEDEILDIIGFHKVGLSNRAIARMYGIDEGAVRSFLKTKYYQA